MSDFITSLIRTYVPIVVGTAISALATRGLEVDPATQASLVAGLTGILIAAYYTAVRALESKYPKIGVLLGSTRKPEYTEPEV